MRIGEVAAKLGVSTRMIRHYHDVGVLPEPARTSGGYRSYTMRDLVRLVRIRRLVALGLSLDDVAATLDEGDDLPRLLRDLDADLAAQEAAIHQKRQRIQHLRRRGVSTVDDLGADDVATLVDGLPLSDYERGLLTVADDTGNPQEQAWLREGLAAMAADPDTVARSEAVWRQVEALDADDVAGGRELAARNVDMASEFFPEDLLQTMRNGRTDRAVALAEIGRQSGLPPAQQAYLVESLRLLLERA